MTDSAPPHAGFETTTLGDDRAEDGEHDLLIERRIGLTRQAIEDVLLSTRIVNGKAHDLLAFANSKHHPRTLGQHAEQLLIDAVDLDTQRFDFRIVFHEA